ncbi:hypothetical protein J4E91_007514 [Alternaria rosae]|nr:hypothetical protein J4E91_007514 [Alternaria rosae]
MAPGNANIGSVDNQRDFPMYGGEQQDIQGDLDGHLHEQPSPMVDEGDWQTEHSYPQRHPYTVYYPQPELDPRNPASHHDPQPQEVDSRVECHSQSLDFDDTFVFVPTFGDDPGNDALGGMEICGEQFRNVRAQFNYDWLTESGTVIDPEPSTCTDSVPATGGQFEHKEGGPWSTENQHNGHPELTPAQLNWLANMAGASETSCTSQDSGDNSNLVPSTSGSAGDSEDPDWGENSVATLRPTHPPPNNPLEHTRYASKPVNHQGQGQNFIISPPGHADGCQGAHRFPTPDRTALQATSRRE